MEAIQSKKLNVLIRHGRGIQITKTIIYLVGFMGAGKSTIGEILAKKLRWEFFDTDKLIEESAKKSISEIFASEGEDCFRDWEEQVVKAVAKDKEDAVVALGGGAILRRINWDLINRSGFTVYLKWKQDVLLNRLANDDSRPLVADILSKSNKEELVKLLQVREPLYAQADIVIDCTEDLTAIQIADIIVNEFEKQE